MQINSPPKTPLEFLESIFYPTPENSEVAITGFTEDPINQKDWSPSIATDDTIKNLLSPENNGYFGISTLHPEDNGDFKAKQANVAATHVLMIDDLGDGSGSKGSLEGLKLKPSYVVETSPNNYQAGYVLKKHITDKTIAKLLTNQLAEKCGGDEGAKNIVRWARVPFCSNTKQRVIEEAGHPFKTKLTEWNPECKYTYQEIADAYDIALTGKTPDKTKKVKKAKCKSRPETASTATTSNHSPNDPLFEWLDKNDHFDGKVSSDGWHSLNCCPWHMNHTEEDEQGSGYGPPNSGTDEDGSKYVYARFKCFHGHCADKDITDFYQYVIDQGYQHCDDDIFYFNNGTLMHLANEIITKTQDDPGYCFEPANIKVLKQVKDKFIPDWQRLRAQFKKLSGISVTSLEKVISTSVSTEHRVQPLDQGQVAEIILKKIGKKNILHTQQSFWQWDNSIGVWKRCDDKELHKIAQEYILGLELNAVSDGFVKGCTSLLKNSTYIRDHKFNRNNKCINLPNGELYYENEEWNLKAHCREHYFISQLPVVYDPAAKAPQFEKFLSDIFEGDKNKEDKIMLIYMCMGYSLLSTARYEKFIILIGNGSNGKSVLLEVLKQLLGSKNVAAVQPSEFNNRFQRAHLQGKLANIVSEIREGKPIDDSALKSITSGEPTTVEHKHKDPFEIEPYSTCWFGTNHMPQTSDFSNGINRRAIIIPFNRQFKEHEQDKHLKDKLCTELPGILNLALNGLKKLFDDNTFISLPEVESAKDQWRNENDQVTQFADDCCEIDPKENIPSKDLFKAYLKWAETNLIRKPINQNQLSSRLKRHNVIQQKVKGVRCLVGIKLL